MSELRFSIQKSPRIPQLIADLNENMPVIEADRAELITESYQQTESLEGADAVLVRSAAMHGMELPKSLLAVARAGAGVNNIPLADCAEQGLVVFSTPGANAHGV